MTERTEPVRGADAAKMVEEAKGTVYALRDEVWCSARGQNNVDVSAKMDDCFAAIDALGAAATQAVGEPVAKVLFRQDEDGLEPVMFYGPGTEPDPATLKDRFVIRDVWLSPPAAPVAPRAGAKPE